MEELGIYIHIPFCQRKCSYCDFISYAGKEEWIEPYIEAVCKEIEIRKIENRPVTSIYLGGGTPSLLEGKQIQKIMEKLEQNFQLKSPEITIEVNPGTVTEEKLKKYRQLGMNRISIGLQSSNNELLQRIGRIHTYEQFENTYDLARKVGFQNCNVDLMLALPGQTLEMLADSLQKLIALHPEHISVYSLILEEGTPMMEWVENRKVELPEDEIERKMYWMVKNKLEQEGYEHYEISNFAKKGYHSRHNENCWKQKEYLGIGVAAHSYYDKKRYSNTEDVKTYVEAMQNKEWENIKTIHEIQTKEEEEQEFILLGLRKIEGVSIQSFKYKFGKNPIYEYRNKWDKLVKEELVQIEGDYIKLTKKGLDLANLVWEEFVE